jgi:hypothetical protein
MSPDRLRPYAAVGALFGATAVLLQFGIALQPDVAKGASFGWSVAMFLGYFTILTNIGCTVAMGAAAVRGDGSLRRFFRRPGVITALATAILIVGAVYHFVLRTLWNPQGWGLVADTMLHYGTPILFQLFWWAAVPGKALAFMQIPAWCAYPLGYFAYVIVRGTVMHVYPYPFVDVGVLGLATVVRNSVGLLAAFAMVAAVHVTINRQRAAPVA